MDMYQKREMRKNKKKNEDKGSLPSTSINWYPGHMAKTKREIKEKIGLIDIVFEVLDARIPLSSKNKDIDDIIKNKTRVIVMTKKDLCDLSETKKWKDYYEKLGYKVILTDLVHDGNLNEILSVTNEIANSMNAKRKEKGLKPRKVRILILGVPNVGKSTLINRLVKKKATNVGNKPGITKNLEWIRINKDLELLDTPGILWPRLEGKNMSLNLASMTAIKEEILNREDVAIYIIQKMLEFYPEQFKARYKLDDSFDEIVPILDYIAKNIGAIKNEDIDYEKVYITILKDLRNGYIGGVTFDRYED